MTHEECLNRLLAHACGILGDKEADEKGYQEYHITLHCTEFVIKAKPLGDLKYEIIGIEQGIMWKIGIWLRSEDKP